jgi:phage shock protein A
MGVFNRFTTFFKAKVNAILNAVEDPEEQLALGLEQMHEQRLEVRKSILDVTKAKKRLQFEQAAMIKESETLQQQASDAVAAGKKNPDKSAEYDEIARRALERKASKIEQVKALDDRIAEITVQQAKIQASEKKLTERIDAFQTHKVSVVASWKAAKAQVKADEALTGMSEEMTDVGVTIQRIEERTKDMQARAGAYDELIDDGTLEDFTGHEDDIARDLAKLGTTSVDEELARLKAGAAA